MKYILIIVLFMLLQACASNQTDSLNSNNEPSKNQVLNYEKSDADYLALIAKIKNNSASAQDYDTLLKLYPLTSFYEASAKNEQKAKLLSQSSMEAQNWQKCFELNQALLALNYTSLTGHYGAAICATEMSDINTGRYHHFVLDSFIEAIWRTGNGQTPQTPFVINSAPDLYAFIQLHQMVATGQAFTYVNDLPIQAIKVQNPETMRSSTWYFDVTAQFRRGLIDQLER